MRGVFLIHHMKRSGGHAVVNWLMENASGAAFVNNEIPIEDILQGRRSMSDGSLSYESWLQNKRHLPRFSETVNASSTLIVSLEDHELRVKPFNHLDTQTIIILRQPENLFASRIKKAAVTSLKAYDLTDPQFLNRAIRIWKEHARAALGINEHSMPIKTILYDAWLTGKAYRATLARDFDFSAPSDPIRRVASAGGGSSFGQTEAQPGDLLRRSDFLDDAERTVLKSIMADPEMADLADRINSHLVQLTQE
jgi:hypothetical protein